MKATKIAISAILISCFVLGIHAQQNPATSSKGQASDKTQTVKVDVDLTVVNATVLDPKGQIGRAHV